MQLLLQCGFLSVAEIYFSETINTRQESGPWYIRSTNWSRSAGLMNCKDEVHYHNTGIVNRCIFYIFSIRLELMSGMTGLQNLLALLQHRRRIIDTNILYGFLVYCGGHRQH